MSQTTKLHILKVRSRDRSLCNTHQIRNMEPCAASLLLQIQLQVVYITYVLSFTHLQTDPKTGLSAKVTFQQVRGLIT